VVRVHADDARALRSGGPGADVVSAAGGTLVLREDASLARGDCVVETELGTVDGRLAARLELLRRALLAGLAGASDEEGA
jgi:flagellar biosynthesis/type III secretory pathway protein FliH